MLTSRTSKMATGSWYFLSFIACSTAVFFGRVNVFARESAMLKLQNWGGNGASQKGRGPCKGAVSWGLYGPLWTVWFSSSLVWERVKKSERFGGVYNTWELLAQDRLWGSGQIETCSHFLYKANDWALVIDYGVSLTIFFVTVAIKIKHLKKD